MDIGSRWRDWPREARQFSIIAVLSVFCSGLSLKAQQMVPEMPMQPRYEDGAEFRWLNKKVLDTRLLD
ncbi:MAG TPA: hypothetical protein VNO32_22380, partial [Candidatus Acidoferrum sp.]|nr:hypothetical protein [Candidatus Acidoferrum sp.]